MPNSIDFAGIELVLTGAEELSGFDFGRAVRQAAEQIFFPDSFYLCLVGEEGAELQFIYNEEGGVWDHPETYPLGDGPTSWVVRNGRSLEVRDGSVPEGLAFAHFGDRAQITKTQLHLPCKKGMEDTVSAVYSVQWHEQIEIKEDISKAFHWLSARVGNLLQTRNRLVELKREVASAGEAARVSERITVNNGWCTQLDMLCKHLEKPHPQNPFDPGYAVTRIRSLMTEAILRAPQKEQDNFAQRIRLLTLRERQVLALAAAGFTNAQIADHLMVGMETIKHHMSNALGKMGFPGRQAAIRNCERITAALHSFS